MANTNSPNQQNTNNSVPIWLIAAIVLLVLFSCIALALVYQQASSAPISSDELPTQAAIAQAPTITSSPTGGPQGPTNTATWTPRPSSTPYFTPTFVNTAVAPEVNTRAAGEFSSNVSNQIITDSGSGAPVVVPTVTQAIPRSTQTSVAATATQAITNTKVAATQTQVAVTATSAAATATSAAFTATPPPGIWRGDYYNNKDLQDPIVWVQEVPVQTVNNLNLGFNWGTGSPDQKVNSDNFSARWRLNADFGGANYLFYAFSDDGVRVFADNNTVIDKWTNASNKVQYGTHSFSSGQHPIKVEYFEADGDARIAVGWQFVKDNAWIGEYFSNKNLGQPPTYISQDDAINFTNWNDGGPNGLPSDNFSIRWFKDYDFGSTTSYLFTVRVEDGVRVIVDGNTIIDEWHSVDAPTTYTATRELSGSKKVTVEYYAGTGNAEIQFDIASVAQPTPNATATAAAQATIDAQATINAQPTPNATATSFSATATANGGIAATSIAATATANAGIAATSIAATATANAGIAATSIAATVTADALATSVAETATASAP